MAKGNGTTTTIDVASLPKKPERKIARRFTPQERLQAVERIQKDVGRGFGVEEACKNAGITDATYYTWRKNAGRDKKAAKKLNGKARPVSQRVTWQESSQTASVQVEILLRGVPHHVSLEDARGIYAGLTALFNP